MKRGKMQKTKLVRKQELPKYSYRKECNYSVNLLNKKYEKYIFCSITVRAKLLLGTTKIRDFTPFHVYITFNY